MRTVLLIARVFAPAGGGGTQRPTKLARYLPDHGWAPHVLTLPAPIDRADPGLVAELPDSVRVTRLTASAGTRLPKLANALSAGWIYKRVAKLGMLGDPGFVDLPEMVATGRRLAKGADAIIATSLPFSSVVAGAMIAEATGRPLIADLRDPWAFGARDLAPSPVHRAAMRLVETWALSRATAVVLMTERSRGFVPPAVTDRVEIIPNGFDPADLKTPAEPRSRPSFRVVYTGTLYGKRTPRPMLAALTRIAARADALCRPVELIVAGSTFEHTRMLDESPIPTELRGYRPHAEVVALTRSADAVIVLVGDEVADEQPVPAKLYEAIAAGPPVVAWARQRSEAARVIEQTGAGYVAASAEAMADALLTILEDRADLLPLAQRPLEPYDRRTIAARYAALLDRVAPATDSPAR